jgi:hypothetical protein
MTIVFRDVKPIKTVTVEATITKSEARTLLTGAQRWLGHIVAEYDEQEAFRFLIDDAKADVAKWHAVLDSFD